MGELALVTGASSGIGDAFARALAEDGHDLVVVARDEARLGALAEDLTARHGIDCEVLVADLTDPAALDRVADRLTDDARPVELLVNNAGFGTSGRFVELPFDAERREIELNVLALHRLTHAVLSQLVSAARGGIINVSSIGGYQPGPGFATYCATKAFVTSFTQALHEELIGTGVRAMVVCPGFTRTEFQERSGAGDLDMLPSFVWQDADEVVRHALRDYAKGRALSVPGPINKTTAAFAATVPGLIGRKVFAAGWSRSH